MICKDIATLCPLYLSEELDGTRALAFGEHLRACPACDADIKEQKRLDAVLRDRILSEPIDSAVVDERVRMRISPPRRNLARTRAWFMAASVAAILLAGAGYRMFVAKTTPRLFADAVRDHRNEVMGGQHRTWLIDAAKINDLAQRHGVSPAIVAKLTPVGYRLVEAKICRLDGRVFLHLVYAENGAGRLSTYLRALDNEPLPGATRETESGKDVHAFDSGDEHVAAFQSGQLTAMFVSNESDAAALSFARLAARRL